jgi:hypothetical protein
MFLYLLTKFGYYDDYRTAVASCKDEIIRKAMSRLLNLEWDAFRPTDDIIHLFNDPERNFSYQNLIQRTDSLLRQWTELALGKPRSAERYLSRGDTAAKWKQRQQEGIKRLQESRARLSKRVPDPLPDVAVMAKNARRLRISSSVSLDDDNYEGRVSDEAFQERKKSRKRKVLELNPSTTRVDFRHDDEEEIMDESDASPVSHDEDDYEDYREIRDQAFEVRKERLKGKFLKHKKSATKVDFESDDEEGIMEERDRRGWEAAPQAARLVGKKLRKSQRKTYQGRRPWTQSESYAIKEGIAAFGWGKWAEIKDYYNAILRNRTSSQIKVRQSRRKRTFHSLEH